MKRHNFHLVLAPLLTLAVLSGCSDDAPSPAPTSAAPGAEATAAAPVVTDEAGLRKAAASALAEQRMYTPAGNNAIEHYLALRELRPDERATDTALLELLPYALIGSEQAVGRQDFVEARRLLDLVERVDPQAPALGRLRDSVAAAEAEAARRIVAEAEAEKLREQQALLAAEQARAAATLAAEPAASGTAPPATAPVAAPSAPPTAAAPTTATPAPITAPVPTATAPRPATPAAAPAIPRLLSAPSPRYPLMAMRRKLEGDVTVAFTILPDGSVSSPRVVNSTTPGLFDEAALVAASRWRFETGSASVSTSRVVQFRLAAAQP